MWINENTLVVYNYVYEIRQAFPDVSFPEYATDSDFEVYGVYPVQKTPPPQYDPITQDLIEEAPQKFDGVWVQVWSVEPATPEEIAVREEAARQTNKSTAESLLQATDWTENASARNTEKTPHLMNGEAFDDYRVALRTIAVNPPVVVELWPTKPEEIWSTTQG